jgi:[ribosomal protein S18]-alanine N-acetyltransferase
MDDVLSAHRLAGGRPSTWWIAEVDHVPAACVLVNDHTDSAEVVYLGVAPEYRRRGLARCMLDRAARAAAARGLASLTLAVDAANTPAMAAYAAAGFEETDRRIACFVTGKMLENTARKPAL